MPEVADVAAAGTLLSWDHRRPDALRWTKALRALVQGMSADEDAQIPFNLNHIHGHYEYYEYYELSREY